MEKYIKSFYLLGGEPFLNKDLINFIPLIKKYFYNAEIEILTNGSKIKDLTKDDFNILLKNKVSINVTKYPVEEIDYNIVFNKLNDSLLNWHYLPARALFQRSLINVNKSGNAAKNFQNCSRHKFPCFTLQDYKIFFCPDSCCIPHIKLFNIKNTEKDYLDINTINIEKIKKFCSVEKDICSFCNNNDEKPILWNRYQGLSDYYYTLLDYFLYDYDTYLKIIENQLSVDYFFNTIENFNNIDYNFFTQDLYKKIIQYKNSKIDIIIPFYNVNNNIMQQLKKELLSQSIIQDCTIYFISDNSP